MPHHTKAVRRKRKAASIAFNPVILRGFRRVCRREGWTQGFVLERLLVAWLTSSARERWDTVLETSTRHQFIEGNRRRIVRPLRERLSDDKSECYDAGFRVAMDKLFADSATDGQKT